MEHHVKPQVGESVLFVYKKSHLIYTLYQLVDDPGGNFPSIPNTNSLRP